VTTEISNNVDSETVRSFGSEWTRFDQTEVPEEELSRLFHQYFGLFPWDTLPAAAEGFDMGCGSGRWATLVAPRVGLLNCIDPSTEALAVAGKALARFGNTRLLNASVADEPLPPASQDFGYSLGVLHHVPDTAAAIKDCVQLLKPGAPFLVYLYYRFDNRPFWFRALWQVSDLARRGISRLPERAKLVVTDAIATCVYWPLARVSAVVERVGVDPSFLPLSFYRSSSFYTMRTDSRDRFGTPLERRFTRAEIQEMLCAAGLSRIQFSQDEPYWIAVGVKKA